MKFAVYIITIEDTEDNDMRVADLYPENMTRAAGNMEPENAEAAHNAAEQAAKAWDEGIAR